MNTPAAQPAKRKAGAIKWVLRIIGLLAVLVVLAGGYVYWQARQITENLESAKPLTIERVKPTPKAKKALRQKIKASVQLTRKAKLTGPELTAAVQEMLAERALLGTLRRERKRLVAGLAKIDDPFGLIAGIRLGDLDLNKIAADVAIEGDRATVRATAPYKNGGHLNLRGEFTGHYRRETPSFTLHSLHVGEINLLGLTGFGDRIRTLATDALLDRARKFKQKGISEAFLKDAHLVFVVRR
jgi:hypothetical protein